MNRNEPPPDSGFNSSQDAKDYKTIVLLVLGIFILAWQAFPFPFSTSTGIDVSEDTSLHYIAKGQQQIAYHSTSSSLSSLPNQLRPLFFQPISINLSDQPLLESIPGIGPYLSGQIVNYRKAHGDFTDLQELLNVHGIGDKKLAIIKNHTVL